MELIWHSPYCCLLNFNNRSKCHYSRSGFSPIDNQCGRNWDVSEGGDVNQIQTIPSLSSSNNNSTNNKPTKPSTSRSMCNTTISTQIKKSCPCQDCLKLDQSLRYASEIGLVGVHVWDNRCTTRLNARTPSYRHLNRLLTTNVKAQCRKISDSINGGTSSSFPPTTPNKCSSVVYTVRVGFAKAMRLHASRSRKKGRELLNTM